MSKPLLFARVFFRKTAADNSVLQLAGLEGNKYSYPARGPADQRRRLRHSASAKAYWIYLLQELPCCLLKRPPLHALDAARVALDECDHSKMAMPLTTVLGWMQKTSFDRRWRAAAPDLPIDNQYGPGLRVSRSAFHRTDALSAPTLISQPATLH
jgi:hypothetical protein